MNVLVQMGTPYKIQEPRFSSISTFHSVKEVSRNSHQSKSTMYHYFYLRYAKILKANMRFPDTEKGRIAAPKDEGWSTERIAKRYDWNQTFVQKNIKEYRMTEKFVA